MGKKKKHTAMKAVTTEPVTTKHFLGGWAFAQADTRVDSPHPHSDSKGKTGYCCSPV